MIVKNENDMSFVKSRFIPIKNKLLHKTSAAETRFETLLSKTDYYLHRN